MHRVMLHVWASGCRCWRSAACGAEPTLPLAIEAARNAVDLVQTAPAPAARPQRTRPPRADAADVGGPGRRRRGDDGAARQRRRSQCPRRGQRMDAALPCDPQTPDRRGAIAARPRGRSQRDRWDAHTARHGRRRSRSVHRPTPAGPRRRRPRRGIGGSTALTVAVSGGALTDLDRPIFGGCHPATVKRAPRARSHAAGAGHDRRTRGALVGQVSWMRRRTVARRCRKAAS